MEELSLRGGLFDKPALGGGLCGRCFGVRGPRPAYRSSIWWHTSEHGNNTTHLISTYAVSNRAIKGLSAMSETWQYYPSQQKYNITSKYWKTTTSMWHTRCDKPYTHVISFFILLLLPASSSCYPISILICLRLNLSTVHVSHYIVQ